jgi:flagellar M-ring protein FliF
MAVTAEEVDMQNQVLLEQDQGGGFDEASSAPVLVEEGNMPAAPQEQSNTVVDFLNQPAVQRTLPVIGGLLAIVGIIMAVALLREDTNRVLYPDMSEADRAVAYEQLMSLGIEAKLDQATGALLVPSEQYYEARMQLASAGIPSSSSLNAFESLGLQSSLTTSQFMEQAQYTAAIEFELARSISQINSVQSARVHIAASRQSSYIRNREPAKASVVVKPYPGRVITDSQVQSIVNLVSSSIPYLSTEAVSVVNAQGNLLSDNLSPGMREANEQSRVRTNLEDSYQSKIIDILAPIFGRDNVQADVDVTLDFTEYESTSEIIDGNGSGAMPISEVVITDTSRTAAAIGVPGGATNIVPNDTILEQDPEVDQEAQEVTEQIVNSQTTRDYDYDRSIRYQRNATGVLTRLSVAVVVNELAANRSIAQEDGSETFVPILSEERLVSLIEGAVGYSADRGDSVAVSISPFLAEDIIEISIPWYENEAIRYWARIVLIFASLVLFLMIAVRPLVGRLVGGQVMGVTFGVKQTEAKGGKSTVVESLDELTDELSEEEAAEAEEMMDAGESLEEIKKKIQTKKSRISADMLDTANSYDDKVAVVRLLVGEDVGRVANVFKKMIKV